MRRRFRLWALLISAALLLQSLKLRQVQGIAAVLQHGLYFIKMLTDKFNIQHDTHTPYFNKPHRHIIT